MAITSKFSFADLQNPLFLHPSDGPLSISVTKLQGAADYRTWRRSMEIQLSSKRKLGFVEGTELRSTTDAAEAVQWDTCNNMVLSWLHSSVCDSIKQSVMFINTSVEIWKQLEKRFQLSNGSRKYKLSKDLYSLKQNGKSLVDYYTTLSAMWEELEAMNNLPVLTTTSDEIKTLLQVIQIQRDESKLFQFLNGLDDMFGPQRSQLLMMSPLPSVELACAVIQQEESQRDVLHSHPTDDISAMFSKGVQQGAREKSGDNYVVCTVCKRKGHSADTCWTIVGYPKWHYRNFRSGARGGANSGRWNGQRSTSARTANSVQTTGEDSSDMVITHQQFEQLLKLIPGSTGSSSVQSGEDFDTPFSAEK